MCSPPNCRGYRFPAEIISHTVWLYHRFTLSLRDIQDLLAERRFCQLDTAEANRIVGRNHPSMSLDAGRLLPRRKGTATKDSIIRCPQQMSADAKQIVDLPVNAQKSLRLS